MAMIEDSEQEALLAVYHEAYIHARHGQHINSTYFNYFLLIVGVTVAALVNIVTREGSTSRDSNNLWIIALGSLIWFISFLTMQKTELISAHVSHDLIKVRRVHILLRERYVSIADVVSSREDPTDDLGPNRKFLDVHRSPEPLAALIGAVAGALIVALQLSAVLGVSNGSVIGTVGVAGAIIFGYMIPYYFWDRVRKAQIERHRECCLMRSLPDTGKPGLENDVRA